MSIVYEVTVKVAQEIMHEFSSWVDNHVQEMLAYKGFVSAQIFEEVLMPFLGKNDYASHDKNQKSQNIIIQYTLTTLAELENYFASHASIMREKGVTKFGENMVATRRVFKKVTHER